VPAPLLSTYRAGENRLTASTMAVFERIDLALVQELLAAATESGDELRTVTFENQVLAADSVPDARISGRFTWWFETKTTRDAYSGDGHARRQLREHSRLLEADPEARLFVLTPDLSRPPWFDELDGVPEGVRDQVLWLGFRELADQITAIVGDPTRLLGEQTRFLLSELVALYESDGLLTADDTVIVAARAAWPEYRRYSAYVCQPDRTFRTGLSYFGFYAERAIQPVIPRIRAHYPAVVFTRAEATERRADGDDELATLIEDLLSSKLRAEGESYGVLLLTAEDDPDTVRLPQPIANDTTTSTGKRWAWTLGQRYTDLDRLRKAVVTSDL
jgi:hypothetical protein